MIFTDKRVTIFCGHYGSGKTNIAINYALGLKSCGRDVAIADLDIVNPYFRTKDSEEMLVQRGIGLIALPFAGSNVDLPALPSAIYSIVQNKERFNVLDIGGDDRGAYALGRIAKDICDEGNYDCFFVVNFRRPLTPDAKSAKEVLEEIEAVSGIPFTGIVNNTNIGAETSPGLVIDSEKEIAELEAVTGLKKVFTAARYDIAGQLEGSIDNLLPMVLQRLPVE